MIGDNGSCIEDKIPPNGYALFLYPYAVFWKWNVVLSDMCRRDSVTDMGEKMKVWNKKTNSCKSFLSYSSVTTSKRVGRRGWGRLQPPPSCLLIWYHMNLTTVASFWKSTLYLQYSWKNMMGAGHHYTSPSSSFHSSLSFPNHTSISSFMASYMHKFTHTHTHTRIHRVSDALTYFPYLSSKLKPPQPPQPHCSQMSGCLSRPCHFSH